MIERVCADPSFNLSYDEIHAILKPINFVGRSVEQVTEFLQECVQPVLDANKDVLGENAELTV